MKKLVLFLFGLVSTFVGISSLRADVNVPLPTVTSSFASGMEYSVRFGQDSKWGILLALETQNTITTVTNELQSTLALLAKVEFTLEGLEFVKKYPPCGWGQYNAYACQNGYTPAIYNQANGLIAKLGTMYDMSSNPDNFQQGMQDHLHGTYWSKAHTLLMGQFQALDAWKTFQKIDFSKYYTDLESTSDALSKTPHFIPQAANDATTYVSGGQLNITEAPCNVGGSLLYNGPVIVLSGKDLFNGTTTVFTLTPFSAQAAQAKDIKIDYNNSGTFTLWGVESMVPYNEVMQGSSSSPVSASWSSTTIVDDSFTNPKLEASAFSAQYVDSNRASQATLLTSFAHINSFLTDDVKDPKTYTSRFTYTDISKIFNELFGAFNMLPGSSYWQNKQDESTQDIVGVFSVHLDLTHQNMADQTIPYGANAEAW